jgi:hypothetical protein
MDRGFVQGTVSYVGGVDTMVGVQHAKVKSATEILPGAWSHVAMVWEASEAVQAAAADADAVAGGGGGGGGGDVRSLGAAMAAVNIGGGGEGEKKEEGGDATPGDDAAAAAAAAARGGRDTSKLGFLRLFVNGIEVGAESVGGSATQFNGPIGPWYLIGRRPVMIGEGLKGSLSEVRLWCKPRSAWQLERDRHVRKFLPEVRDTRWREGEGGRGREMEGSGGKGREDMEGGRERERERERERDGERDGENSHRVACAHGSSVSHLPSARSVSPPPLRPLCPLCPCSSPRFLLYYTYIHADVKGV